MKTMCNHKISRYFISVILILAMVFGMMLQEGLSDSANIAEASANQTDTLDVSKLWTEKRSALGWCDSNNTPLPDMWEDTSTLSTEWLATSTDASGGNTVQPYEQINGALGQRIDITGDIEGYTYTDTVRTVKSCKFSGTTEQEPVYTTDTTSAYVRERYSYTFIPNAFVSNTMDDLYYSVEYDEVLEGCYRKYYVSTADQLAVLLYNYENNFAALKAVQKSGNKPYDTELPAVNKLGIELLCDIDLGGDEHSWVGYTRGVCLDIDGNGHKVYNGYFSTTSRNTEIRTYTAASGNYKPGDIQTITSEFGFFLRKAQKFAIHDVTFGNMFISHAGGMFGDGVKYAYFNNVNWEHCMAIGDVTGVTIVLGYSYNQCYFKDCMIKDSYVRGNGHCALFSSYNSGADYYKQSSYLGDTTAGITSYYYTEVPELSGAELEWQKKTVDSVTYTDTYPSIYENCATVDSEVYDGGEHSGTFVSCMQSGIIFKDCFSNSTIYAANKIGVFIGCLIGSANGFWYDVDGERTLANAYFENCYTSGAVEGKNYIGGFVGGIFNDVRAYDPNYSLGSATAYRGQAVFKNCYSTSSVGMEYSGTYVGGFAGTVYGNIQAEDPAARRHIFINCYAAGEVGGIITDTETANNKITIGGFFGNYWLVKTAYGDKYFDNTTIPQLTNCFYDKQTTAMRERDIGGNALYHTLDGLEGVYTTASSAKGILGLTDTGNIMTNEGWTYRDEYYPQLTAFTRKPSVVDSDDLVSSMYYERQMTYYYYSLASTATVFLDHYDKKLNESGIMVAAEKEIYDTVRDITRKFDFTSDSEIRNWKTDEALNNSRGFYSTLGGDEQGFSISYTSSRDYIKDTSGYSRAYNPSVLTIANVDDVWKCLDFAPGKQWVSVTCGSGKYAGHRYLRLLPTAYLNAGNIMNINVSEVTENDKTIITNEVTVNSDSKASDGSIETIPLTKFNHSVGVAYAITDKYRMGYTNIYKGQTVMEYSDASVSDNTSFAFYKTYPLNPDAVDNNPLCVGLTSDGKMYAQEFVNDNYDNNSTEGMTMVRVYETEPVRVYPNDENSPVTLEIREEITDPEELKKWQGESLFETTDKGYYYMKYYWRLDDGRYLEDTKLVRISNNEYSVEIITGILGEEHTVTDSTPATTAIDMYVTSDIENPIKPYPSADALFSRGTAADMYDTYNSDMEHNGDIYKIKSNKIVTGSPATEVGWYRSPEFKITTLIVEAQDSSGTWHEMTRLDDPAHTDKFDFEDAKYQYQYTTYAVSQDPVTKLFNIEQNPTREVEFKVESASTDLTGISKSILFSFAASGDDVGGSDFSDINDNLRITVLFRRNEADIKADKTVLMGETVIDSTDGNTISDKSFDEKESYREVDNTGIDIEQNRKAVIGGDILTYRVKLHNTGYIDSAAVNVYDVVPEGCTFIPDSMKIYCQEADFSTSTVKYGAVVDKTLQDGYSISHEEITSGEYQGRERLVWTIPRIELDHNYYVEYQVKVEDIAATDEKRLLTNTATWDFISLNGDTDDNSDSTSVEAYKQHAIFDMNVDVLKSDKEEEDRTYYIYFEQMDSDAYTDITFTNYFPTGFTYDDSEGIHLYKKSGTDADGEETYEPVAFGTGENDVKLSMDSTNTYFELSNLNLSQGDKYKVKFSGTQKTLGIGDNHIDEIRNKSLIIYTKTGVNTYMGNSIIKTERLTNAVETDVTWLYLNIEKNISINDKEQSFLMQVAYYKNDTDTKPTDVFYTRINCTEAISGADGNSVTGYRGNQIIQCGKRGKYVVTEVTDWSDTDYDFDKSVAYDMSLTDSSGNQIYPNDVEISSKKIAYSDHSVMIELPRLMYESGAFPTSLGTDITKMPTAVFYNDESDYAYLSGQSYSENNIMK